MAASAAARLYTPEILALAVELADYPLAGDLPLLGEARSRSCGSSVRVGCSVRSDGAVERFGLQATACAIGQASAAIFARQVTGRTARQLVDDGASVEKWLSGEGNLPNWPGIQLLEAAREHPARHGAILLPWKATLDALSKGDAES